MNTCVGLLYFHVKIILPTSDIWLWCRNCRKGAINVCRATLTHTNLRHCISTWLWTDNIKLCVKSYSEFSAATSSYISSSTLKKCANLLACNMLFQKISKSMLLNSFSFATPLPHSSSYFPLKQPFWNPSPSSYIVGTVFSMTFPRVGMYFSQTAQYWSVT